MFCNVSEYFTILKNSICKFCNNHLLLPFSWVYPFSPDTSDKIIELLSLKIDQLERYNDEIVLKLAAKEDEITNGSFLVCDSLLYRPFFFSQFKIRILYMQSTKWIKVITQAAKKILDNVTAN